MFGFGALTAREEKVGNYSEQMSKVFREIEAAPLAPQRPASVKAAGEQMNQWNEYGYELRLNDIPDSEFKDYIAYGDDVLQAMNEILYDLTPASVDPDEPPMVAGVKPKLDVGKLVAGLAVVGTLGYLVWKFSKPAVPAFAGFHGLRGDLVPFDNAEAVAQRLLASKAWRGSTMVDVGNAIEIRHPSGAKATIQKRRSR